MSLTDTHIPKHKHRYKQNKAKTTQAKKKSTKHRWGRTNKHVLIFFWFDKIKPDKTFFFLTFVS